MDCLKVEWQKALPNSHCEACLILFSKLGQMLQEKRRAGKNLPETLI